MRISLGSSDAGIEEGLAPRTWRMRALCHAAYLLVVAPTTGSADLGVPMLFVTFPAMFVALVPIIWIEAHYALRRLGLAYRQALGVSAAANAASTVIGLPVTWLVLVGVQLLTGGGNAYGLQTLPDKLLAVTWQSPWLIPYEGELVWMIPAATLCLLVPFFFASALVEYQVARRMLSAHARDHVLAAIWRANLLSYGLLAAVVSGWLIHGLGAQAAA
jgi:hypothetical protein